MANKTKNESNNNDNKKKEIDIQMRPYFEDRDRKYVQYLFYSTYLNLVPRGVKLRLVSFPPILIIIWLCLFASLIQISIKLIHPLQWPTAVLIIYYSALVFASVGLGLMAVLWYVDKYDVSVRVLEGLDNDLGDIEAFYREQKVNDQSSKGQFWVLTVNGDIVGCIGVDQHTKPVYKKMDPKKQRSYIRASEQPRMVDSPDITQADWRRTAYVMALLDDWVRFLVVGATDIVRDHVLHINKNKKDNDKKEERELLFPVHKSNEASFRRLAIKTEYQGHGLSTPLLKRVIFWAHSQNIDYLFAETNELQNKLEQILEKKLGYTLVSRTKLSSCKSKAIWRLDVKLWMQNTLEERKALQELEEQQKEDEELKKYE
ncbi:hypothetical protein BJ944DRAFT_156553 [Cunninghamella echinulata]|nr:hypothetical protein BJ944DRAFT_156553 [Cunninghamella echinulata]